MLTSGQLNDRPPFEPNGWVVVPTPFMGVVSIANAGSGSLNDINIGLLAMVVYGVSVKTGPKPKSRPIASAVAVCSLGRCRSKKDIGAPTPEGSPFSLRNND